MKKIKLISLLCMTCLGSSAIAFATEKKWEIWTGGIGSVNLKSQGCSDSDKMHTLMNLGHFAMSPRLGYIFMPGLEAVLSTGLLVEHQDKTTQTILNPMLGLNFSFFQDLMEDSPYIQLMAGIAHHSNSTTQSSKNHDSETYFSVSAELGKRFKLADGITYAPAVAYQWTDGKQATTKQFTFMPIQFSFLL